MKFTIERSTLLKSLAHVQNIVERRNTIPILSNVKIEASENILQLNATDMDLDIVETITADIKAEGSITLSAHTFYDIIRKLPDGSQVELNVSGEGQLFLNAGRSQFTLSCLPTAEFPIMSSGSFIDSFTLSASKLRSLIDRTKFAISTEETRYYLNGIFLHKTENNSSEVLRAVSTDGHRLARGEVPLPEGAEKLSGIIIPRKTVVELRKLIDEIESDVEISFSETKIQFLFNDTIVTSKLIDGTFPDYERVIPSGNDKEFEVDSSLLASAVDRVSAISNEKSRAVKLSVSSSKLILSASSPEYGSAKEEIEIDYHGEGADIGFNASYLLDIMRQIESESVQVSFCDSASPTILREAKDSSALYVLMPMRV